MSTGQTLLLVHGAWHGPWCWAEMAESLREEGYTVEILTLPGHGRPGSHDRIWPSVRKYVRAVEDAVKGRPEPPILVGHSLGGYVVVRYLEQHEVPGAVLLAPVPRFGVLPTMMKLLWTRPLTTLKAIATFNLWPVVGAANARSELFLGVAPPPGAAEVLDKNIQNESYLAFLATLLRWPRPKRVSSPTMVVAAEHDALFSVGAQRRLGRALGAPVKVVPGGHDIMLDNGRAAAVEAISAWVEDL